MTSSRDTDYDQLRELMTAPVPGFNHEDYSVGWICVLPCELTGALAMFDQMHPRLRNPPSDENVYSYGSIFGHNVVVACLPAGQYGTTHAATVTERMLATFKSITIPLLVGIGGGIPGPIPAIVPQNTRPSVKPMKITQPDINGKSSSGNPESSSHPALEEQPAPNCNTKVNPIDMIHNDHIRDPIPDIRLGDVVVSVPTPDCPAVVQHDSGKRLANGKLEIKGTLNKPKPRLLQAVTNLSSRHGLSEIQPEARSLSTIIGRALKNNPHLVEEGFAKPEISDVLYEPGCEHVDEMKLCDICGPVKQIPRSIRPITDPPHIHRGPIASGNAVMKSSRVRDEIARDKGILCFEMEAAGLMDSFQCLVIRGICDYCEPRKNKHFQKYAAIAAAAYAKQLLAIIPQTAPEYEALRRQNRLQVLVDALYFPEADFRLRTIKDAHRETCKWLLQQSTYREWLDDSMIQDHHGLLWIKGKPAVGKSTLMKYALKQTKTEAIIISFFFHARGSLLAKTTHGMYRSLLSQLLSTLPGLRYALRFPESPDAFSDVEVLKDLFVSAVRHLTHIPVICFIDALDESDEDEIRDLIEVLELLGNDTASKVINFRVCCASRHYPHVSVRKGLEFHVEKISDHWKDISTYVDSELIIGQSNLASEIKDQIIGRSGGIFLWVVLVVQILKKEYDRGRIHAMKAKLSTLPTKLTELFRSILLRDKEDLEELVLCIQWVLHAKRPLNPQEFYFAMFASHAGVPVAVWNPNELTIGDMKRYIQSSSKGLVELTVSKTPTVQLIHESVREFLLDTTAMSSLWTGFEATAIGSSHEKLKQCCYRYVQIDTLCQSLNLFDLSQNIPSAEQLREILLQKFPFTGYAIDHVLLHAEEAHRFGFTQSVFLQHFLVRRWQQIKSVLDGTSASSFNGSIARVLGQLGLRGLESDRQIECPWPMRDRIMYQALKENRLDITLSLISMSSTNPLSEDVAKLLFNGQERFLQTSFASYLIDQGSHRLIAFLLASRAWVESQDRYEILCLMAKNQGDSKTHLNFMIQNLEQTSQDQLQHLLFLAAQSGNLGMVNTLISHGVSVELPLRVAEEVPLVAVVSNDLERVVSCLINNRVNLETAMLTHDEDGPFRALHGAVRRGNFEICKMLVEAGADVDARASIVRDETALHIAAAHGHHSIVSFLLRNGANPKAQNKNGLIPMGVAARAGNMLIVGTLSPYTAPPGATHVSHYMLSMMADGYLPNGGAAADFARLCW